MARDWEIVGGADYLTASQSLISGLPLTIAVWENREDTGTRAVGACQRGTDNNYRCELGTSNANPYQAYIQTNAGLGTNHATSTTVANGVWAHVCGVWVSATERYVYLNGGGVGGGTGLASRNPTSMDTFVIGAYGAGTNAFDGSMAEHAIWNTNLTAAEVAILALGYPPLFIRPQNLVSYVPMIRNDNELINRLSYSLTGSLASVPHPRVFYSRINISPSLAAAATAHPRSFGYIF